MTYSLKGWGKEWMDDQDKESAHLSSLCSPAVEPGLKSRPPWSHFGEDSYSQLCSTAPQEIAQATVSGLRNRVKEITTSSRIRKHWWHEDLRITCGSLTQRVQDLCHYAFVNYPPRRTILKLPHPYFDLSPRLWILPHWSCLSRLFFPPILGWKESLHIYFPLLSDS